MKPTFEQLQETARALSAKTLEEYIVPARIQNQLVVGLAPESDYRVFEVFVPGSGPFDEQVVARAWMNIHTGEGVVHVIGLARKRHCLDVSNAAGWKPQIL